MTIARSLVAATLTALVLTGCAAGTPASDAVTGASTNDAVEPLPTSTADSPAGQVREISGVKPAQVFGGDCEALFTSEDVGNALGIAVGTFDSYTSVGVGNLYIEQFGGIQCAWGNANFDAYVQVVALPAAAVSYSETTACDVNTEGGNMGCALEASSEGIWLSGAVFRADNDTTALRAAQSALLDVFDENATASNAAPLPLAPAGSWAWPTDCAAVVAAGDFSAVPGLGASVVGGAGGGSDAYYPRAQWALWGDFGPFCSVWNGTVYVGFEVLGGARWAEADVRALPGASVSAVDGVDVVVLSPTEGGATRVDAFDGPNWVTFYVQHASNAAVMAQALVAALDTTAIS